MLRFRVCVFGSLGTCEGSWGAGSILLLLPWAFGEPPRCKGWLCLGILLRPRSWRVSGLSGDGEEEEDDDDKEEDAGTREGVRRTRRMKRRRNSMMMRTRKTRTENEEEDSAAWLKSRPKRSSLGQVSPAVCELSEACVVRLCSWRAPLYCWFSLRAVHSQLA